MTDGEWFSVESDGSDGAGVDLATLLRSFAYTLENAPENKRYDFEIVIEERDIDG